MTIFSLRLDEEEKQRERDSVCVWVNRISVPFHWYFWQNKPIKHCNISNEFHLTKSVFIFIHFYDHCLQIPISHESFTFFRSFSLPPSNRRPGMLCVRACRWNFDVTERIFRKSLSKGSFVSRFIVKRERKDKTVRHYILLRLSFFLFGAVWLLSKTHTHTHPL